MNAQHTPGPWRIHTTAKRDGFFNIEIGTASLNGDGDYTALAWNKADAHLIAAAPDLLELAEAFEAYLLDNSRSERRRLECLTQCQNILLKARP